MEKYDNLGMVGEGSYGMVMKCKHKETGQIVAIKKFLESEDDKMVKKIALREVRMLRKLRHENLVNLIEVFRRKKRLYLVFEFVDHTILDDLEKYPNGLSELAIRKTLWQILRGVEFCHSHNIIHRDIKPENVLNSKNGVVKLCDFGFARTIASSSEIYTDYVATRWYRAPELLVGDVKYGRAVDIWAIGCLVGEMLQGDPIFPGKSDIDQLSKILKCFGNLCPRHKEIFHRNPLFSGMRLPEVKSIESLDKKFPSFSDEILDLMKQCLRLDPNERPSASLLLKHAFFKLDDFEEKVIPELRARLVKDTASNLLARREANEKKAQEKEKKQKKIHEVCSNNSFENKNSSSNETSDKSPDYKNIKSNSPKKQGISPPKKDNLPKTKMKTTSNTKPQQDNKELKPSKSVTNQLPFSDHHKQVGGSCPASTNNFLENSSKELLAMSGPVNVSKKKSCEKILPPPLQTSVDDCDAQANDLILKSSLTERSSSIIELMEDSSESDQQFRRNFETKNLIFNNFKDELDLTSSDSSMLKERQSDFSSSENVLPDVEKSYISKNVSENEHKSNQRKDGGKKPSKEVETFSHQSTIPPISKFQNSSKDSSPDPVLSINTSSSSSSKMANISGSSSHVRGTEKVKKGLALPKKNNHGQQGSFDRSMYPDKTSHFEKMMMSMSGATAITHPAIKRNNASPSVQPIINSTTGNLGASGLQYLRHLRDDKSNNLPLWFSSILEDKNASFPQFSVESGFETSDTNQHTPLEDMMKQKEESPKQSRREHKIRHQNSDDKQSRKPLSVVMPIDKDLKIDSRTSRLPDLGGRPIPAQEREPFPLLKFPASETSSQKPKKTKRKSLLASIPTLEPVGVLAPQQASQSPSPPNQLESNFPSVHAKH